MMTYIIWVKEQCIMNIHYQVSTLSLVTRGCVRFLKKGRIPILVGQNSGCRSLSASILSTFKRYDLLNEPSLDCNSISRTRISLFDRKFFSSSSVVSLSRLKTKRSLDRLPVFKEDYDSLEP